MPVDLEAVSRSLGVGSGTGRNSKLSKALLRLVQFGCLMRLRWRDTRSARTCPP